MTLTATHTESVEATSSSSPPLPFPSFVRANLRKEIAKEVVRKKLRKQRHLVTSQAIDPAYLDALFPRLLALFEPQTVYYNGGVAKVPEWKISCYLEVMDGGVPTTHPHVALCRHFSPLLDWCNDIFLYWYRQQHACNNDKKNRSPVVGCHRLMTFVTRYTPQPGEQALLKVRDG
jgi:hypothetical protein